MMDKVALLGLLAKEIQLNVSIRSATVAREATWWLQYTLVVSGSYYSFNLMNRCTNRFPHTIIFIFTILITGFLFIN